MTALSYGTCALEKDCVTFFEANICHIRGIKECHFALVRRERLLREIVPKKASIHNTLITTFGLKHVEYFGDFVNTITLDDLFQPG